MDLNQTEDRDPPEAAVHLRPPGSLGEIVIRGHNVFAG
jgi:hypothetical protein